MLIPINDDLRIRGTEHCWQLERLRTRKGEPDWAPFKYFQDLGHAVGEACRREIRLHPASSLADALEAVDQVTARYNKLLDDALASREAA